MVRFETLSLNVKRTINLGNYESVAVNVGLSVQVQKNQLSEAESTLLSELDEYLMFCVKHFTATDKKDKAPPPVMDEPAGDEPGYESPINTADDIPF